MIIIMVTVDQQIEGDHRKQRRFIQTRF